MKEEISDKQDELTQLTLRVEQVDQILEDKTAVSQVTFLFLFILFSNS